jgi:GNAT superfamily N-acetyltransferase
MRVRPATVQDAATLAAFRSALFAELGESPAAGFERQAIAAFVAGLEEGRCHAWLAETDDHQPMGAVALLSHPRLPTPGSPADREGYLLNVYTVPRWRGHGVATALVAAAVARGRELGMARIRLRTTAEGRLVYAAAGFVHRLDEMELVLDGHTGGTGRA